MSGGSPLFTDEGPQYYGAAFRHNVSFAKSGPYMTKLNPQQENSFRGWVSANHVSFDVNETVSDYDMRGFWLDQQSGGEPAGREPDGSIGYPDTFKTPYDTTFSKMSKYATPDCPFDWHGNDLIDNRNGTLIFSRGGSNGKQAGGQASLTPGARIWRGAKGFDTGGQPNGGTPGVKNLPLGGTPSIPGGPVSPDEWDQMSPDTRKLAIRTWAVNACRAEGVDEKHWVPYLERVASYESGQSGISGTGNPNVVNMYDENAQKGIPSIGLAQVIQDNAPGQNLLDPVVNLRASIRYIKTTYGDITNIPEAQGIQAGYDTGGSPDPDVGKLSAPDLEKLMELETGKGRWGFPLKGTGLTKLGEHLSEWEIAPTDAPERVVAQYGPEGDKRSRTYYIDPKQAHVQPGGEDEFGPTYPKLMPNDPDAITDYRDIEQDSSGKLWRGMSDEEYQQAKERGYFQSDTSYNLGDAGSYQMDKTFFSTNFPQSANYATGFAPWQLQPTFTRPAHVIGIPDRPDLPRGALGEDPTSSEVGVPGRIPFDEITDHWQANVIGMQPGELSYRPSYFHGEDHPYRTGAPSPDVVWERVPTVDDIIKESLVGINERGGITIDLEGHQPSEGYGYAPSKDTELMFEAGKITPEDVDAYIDSHFEELQKEGMHFGAWVSEEDGAVYLDVSKVGLANAKTIAAAQKAEQLGIWDFGAPPELGEVRIGLIDDAGQYIPLAEASDIDDEHVFQIRQAIEKASAATPVPQKSKLALTFEPYDSLATNGIMARDTDGRPLGYLTWRPNGEIDSVITHPDFRRQGIATDMLAYAREHPDVYESSKPIRQSNQFSEEGRAWAEHGDPEYTPTEKYEPFSGEFSISPPDFVPANQPYDEKSTVPTTLEPDKPEPGARIWKDGKPQKLGKDGPGKGGPGAAKAAEKPTLPETLGKIGKVAGPALTLANDAFMAYGLVDQAAQQGLQEQVAKGNVVAKGPDVLGIPTGTAFSDPTFKNSQSTVGRSPDDIKYWLRTGKWPQGKQSGGQVSNLKLRNGFRIRHADGTTTHHTLSQTGPKDYRADGKIKLLPGDTIEIDGHHS